MLIEERLAAIKQIIEANQSATIEELARSLQVSKDTIRRDLIKLEEQNVLRRTHGGAVLVTREALILNYQQRADQFPILKQAIAYKTVELIKDHATILFDSSTTVEAVIAQLGDKPIYGITNSLTHAMLLAKYKQTEVSVLPGKLHKDQLFLYGTETVKKIEEYTVDYTILGVFALSADGVFIHTEEEGLVKRQMVEQGKTVIALADHTKINTTGFFKICSLAALDILVTDEQPPAEFLDCLTQNDVKVILTKSTKEK